MADIQSIAREEAEFFSDLINGLVVIIADIAVNAWVEFDAAECLDQS